MIISGNNNNDNHHKKKKKIHMSRLLVPFIVASIFAFTIAAIWLQLVTGLELSSTLIACFFTFMGSELGMLCSIKRVKVKNSYTEYEPADKIINTDNEDDDGSVG